MSNKREYYAKCKKCGGIEFRLSQVVEKEKRKTWKDIEINKAIMHDGFGWELEDFDMICTKCGSKESEVSHKTIEE